MKKLAITQVDRFLKPLEILRVKPRPKSGWIRYIRKSIGMTALQLAKRINVSRRRIAKIEADELTDALTIKTLKTVANAMECQFVYAIVPKTTIMKTLETQAKKVAIKQLEKVAHNMNLEAQNVTDQNVLDLQIAELMQQYLNKSFRHLWDE
jgi:predicted DNA-binding mobile mystery protein A